MERILIRRLLKCCELRSAAIATWSKLSAAFETKPANGPDFFNISPPIITGLFGIPVLDTYKGFRVLKDKCLEDADRLLSEAFSSQRNRKLVEVLDELTDTLHKVEDLAVFISFAHPSLLYRRAAEKTATAIDKAHERLYKHVSLYKLLKKVIEEGDNVDMNPLDEYVASLFLYGFERSGIHLSKKQRQKFVELNYQIWKFGQRFAAGCDSPRFVHKNKIPENIRNLFPCDGNRIIIGGVSGDANPLVRELSFKIYYRRDNQQEKWLDQLLLARHQLAHVCGFKAYSEQVLCHSLLENPDVVMSFLDTLSSKLRRYANMDYLFMEGLKDFKITTVNRSIAVWDIPYFMYKLKEEKGKYTDSDFAPYFSLEVCIEGLNNLFYRLYKVKLVSVASVPGETWDSEVNKFAVVHDTEGELGYIYCDFFEREDKSNQGGHFVIRSGRRLSDGSYQQPIIVLMFNLPPPSYTQPTLLTSEMLGRLFHEMGHVMHIMLARTSYRRIAANRCSTDFADVPSVLMEHFAADARVLRSFARHFRTKEPMPEEMLKILCMSKRLFTASRMQEQVFYSALDQMYYGPILRSGTTTRVLAETQEKYYSLPYVKNTSWQLRFRHLFGFGGMYYSYLVSSAVASKIWRMYFEADPFSAAAGERFRRECLAYGAGKPPKELVADFLKEEPSPRMLAEALIEEIDANQTYKNIFK